MTAPADEAPDESAWERWRAHSLQAHSRYHDQLVAIREQHPGLTGYAIVERVDATKGTFAWWWGAASEVRETVNSINAWCVRLHTWNAWNRVVDSFDGEDEKWEVLNDFVEPIAFFCMLQPSSLADRITVAAETLLHQSNLHVIPGRADELDQDDLKPGKTLPRSRRRDQLKRLGQPWHNFPAFRDALFAMDGKDYQKVTRNYRDLTNHSFAPRLMIGDVARAIRSVGAPTKLVEQPDGTYLPVADTTRARPQYVMQSMQPLPLDATRIANLAEYSKARRTMDAFALLITELCDRIDALPKTLS